MAQNRKSALEAVTEVLHHRVEASAFDPADRVRVQDEVSASAVRDRCRGARGDDEGDGRLLPANEIAGVIRRGDGACLQVRLVGQVLGDRATYPSPIVVHYGEKRDGVTR